MPLAVDPLYNRPAAAGASGALMLSDFKRDYRTKPNAPEVPLIDRLTLHAHRLTFAGLDGQAVTIEATLPKDLRTSVKMLTKYSRA